MVLGKDSMRANQSYTVMPYKDNIYMRWMTRADLNSVLNIDWQHRENMWTEGDFLKSLNQRNCVCMVATNLEKAYGFIVYELNKKSISIVNFGVHADFQRGGIGSMMLSKLIDKLKSLKRDSINCYVRESNLIGQLFLKENGFKAIAVEKNYFQDISPFEEKIEDGYLFEYNLV